MNPGKVVPLAVSERRRKSERAGHRPGHGLRAGRQLRQRGAHRQPAVPRRQGPARRTRTAARPIGKVGRDFTVEQAYQHARSVGLDLLAVMRTRARQPGQGEARGEGARHGERGARVHRPPEGDQRLLGPVRRGAGRGRQARALGGRHGLAADGHPGRDRVHRGSGLENLLVVVALLFSSPAVFPSTYPSKPIRMIVPLAAASAVDNAARIVAQRMARQHEGQSIVVENAAGRGRPDRRRARRQVARPTATPSAASTTAS